MLRMFHYWYDLDVIDEDAFFKWKEDISQEHPGKEKALFQVGLGWERFNHHIMYLFFCYEMSSLYFKLKRKLKLVWTFGFYCVDCICEAV